MPQSNIKRDQAKSGITGTRIYYTDSNGNISFDKYSKCGFYLEQSCSFSLG